MKKYDYLYEYPEVNNIKEIVYITTEKYAECNAFVVKEKIGEEIKYRNITFKEFLDAVNDLGTGLFNLGLKGKRVAIIAKNRYEWIWSYISVLLGDMVVVPIDKGLTESELETSLVRSKADAILFDETVEEAVKNIKKNGKTKIKEYINMVKSNGFKYIYDIADTGKKIISDGNKEYIDTEISSDEMRILLFTSGTTANSKAVMLSQRNMASNVYSVNHVEKIYSTDCNLAFLPLHHTMGSMGNLFVYSQGCCTAFPDGLRYIAQNLKEYGVSVFIGVPLLTESIYKKIVKAIDEQGKTKTIKIARKVTNALLKVNIDIRRKVFKPIIDQLGGRIRYIVNGAAGIDPEVSKAFNEFGIELVQGYGLTETSPILTAENDKYIRNGSSGLPMKNVDVKIVDAAENGIGEIVVRGPNVMLGYYEDQEATDEVLKDGWFYTGDLGYLDKDEFLFITGRKKNVIVLKNGKNIYPEELETLVNKIELVKESMVYGMKKNDDVLVSVKVQYDEEIAKEKYEGKTIEELQKNIWDQIKEINKTLPTYKYIKNIVLTKEDFIKTTTAKIKRFEENKKLQEN